MFTRRLPQFLLGWNFASVPSLASYTSLSATLQRRVISFLLRRTIGHLVKEGQLDWNKVEAGIGEGRLEIRDVELDPEAINTFLVDAPVQVADLVVGSISVQIPWSSLWSGDVVISVSSPRLTFTAAQAQHSHPRTSHSEARPEDLSKVADSLLHEDEEGRHLEQSIHDSMHSLPGASSDSDPLVPASHESTASGKGADPEAGSVVASLVEGLLGRLKIQVHDALVTIQYSRPSAHRETVGLELLVEDIAVRTDTEIRADGPSSVREKTRTMEVRGITAWATGQHSSHSSTSQSGNTSYDSDDSTGSETSTDDSDDMMRMSQAVGDLSTSTASVASHYTDASAGAPSMYSSAIDPLASSRAPLRATRQAAPAVSRKKILSLGIEPLLAQMTSRKHVSSETSATGVPAAETATEETDSTQLESSAGQSPFADLMLHVKLGTLACFAEPSSVCQLWTLFDGLSQRDAAKTASQPQMQHQTPSSTAMATLEVSSILVLCAYQDRANIRGISRASLDASVEAFWARPGREQPALDHLRLHCEGLHLNRSTGTKDVASEIAANLQRLRLFERLHSDVAGAVLPIIIFDENLPLHQDAAAANAQQVYGLFDWKSTPLNGASIPYMTTTLGERAWKLKPRHHRNSSSRSTNKSDSSTAAALTLRAHTSPTSIACDLKLAPLHLFADLSLAHRIVPFLHLLGAKRMRLSREDSYGPDSLMASIETLNAGDPSPDLQQHPSPKLTASLGCEHARIEVRVPSDGGSTPTGSVHGLRSGIVAVDFTDFALRTVNEPAAPAPRRVQFYSTPDQTRIPLADASAGSIQVRFHPVNASRLETIAVLTRLKEEEQQEMTLRPRVAIARVTTDPESQSRTSAQISLPLLELSLSKPVLDGLQLLVDDLSMWSSALARIGESAHDEQDGLRILGSRFFGSRSGLSALSSASSESEATLQHAAKGASASAFVELSEIRAVLVIPRHSQGQEDVARNLTLAGREFRLFFDPNHDNHTTMMDLSIVAFSVEEEGGAALVVPTLQQSLARGVAPMLSVNMLFFSDAESSHRESKIEPLLRDVTVTLTEDTSLFKDLAAFAESPAGAFENVEPNELTKLVVKAKGFSLHLAPSDATERAAIVLGDIQVRSRLVGDSPRTTFNLTAGDSAVFLVDEAKPIPDTRRHRVKTSWDHWAMQGYACFAELFEFKGALTTSRLTLPEIEAKISKVRAQVTACADTINVFNKLIPMVLPPNPESEDASEGELEGESEDSSESVRSGNLLSSLDEDAFRSADAVASIPDLLEDDIPTRPEFFGQPQNQPEPTHEEMPMTEEDFFGSESIASMVQPIDPKPCTSSDRVVLQSDVFTVRMLDPTGVRPTEHYFSDPALSPRTRSITAGFASSFRLRVTDCDLALKLHAGYDWAATRNEIEAEIRCVRKRLQKIKQLLDEGQKPDDSVEEATQDLCESMHMAFDADADASLAMNALDDELAAQSDTASSASTWQPLPRKSGLPSSAAASMPPARGKRSKLERSITSMIDFVFRGIELEFDSLVPEASIASNIGLEVQAFQILDNIKTSTWRTFLTAMAEKGPRPKDNLTKMIRVQLLNVKPADGAGTQEEVRVRAKISALRLHVDQDALDFLKKFFAFKKPSEVAAARERASSSGGESEASAPASGPFIQFAEIYPVQLKLDYKPKRVDYDLLRQGKTIEMMNFFHFDGAEMTLRHVTMRGITGWPRLFDTLNDIWTPDVKANQLADVLSGIAPVRSVVNVGAGFADLILIPIEQFQKDGRLAKGLKKGAGRFAKATVLEALKLGAKLATGTQAMLEKAEHILGGSPDVADIGALSQRAAIDRCATAAGGSHRSFGQDQGEVTSDDEEEAEISLIGEEEHRNLISKYADQPSDVRDALAQAYAGLYRGATSAAQTILAVPMEVYEGGAGGSGGGMGQGSGSGSSGRTVVKAVPIAVMQGARGASEAVSKTLMGLKGVLEQQGDAVEEKYKRGDGSGAGPSRPAGRRY